jgi:hypothetical protein
MKKTLAYVFILLVLLAGVAAEAEVDRIIAMDDGRKTRISGKVIDLATGQGLGDIPIEIWCDGVSVRKESKVSSSKDLGEFEFETINANCDVGKEIVVHAWYGGSRYESEKVIVQSTEFRYDRAIVPPIGVPEFSPVTATMAIAVGALGLAAIRKNA